MEFMEITPELFAEPLFWVVTTHDESTGKPSRRITRNPYQKNGADYMPCWYASEAAEAIRRFSERDEASADLLAGLSPGEFLLVAFAPG
jgi:hypothetical protein